ncbi:hypothetical protein, partial [Brevibacterium paucivorans]
GAYPFMALHLDPVLDGRTLRPVSRASSAAPATGLKKVHDYEQAEVIKRVFDK